MAKGNISVNSENIFPVIKKWLYSDKDIFLRELVSNACDAITKLKKLSGIGEASVPADEKYRIDVIIDKENKKLIIADNGIGMTKEEVEKYITDIAFSGATDFLEKFKDESDKDAQIIGHFGLGFYSAFMPSERVEIETLSYKAGESGVKWSCDGGMTYDIEVFDKASRGTRIILTIAEDSKEFLEEYTVRSVLSKYCAFIPVEIYLTVEGEEEKKDDNGNVIPKMPINDTTPLWMKAPKDCTEEEYRAFYKKVFLDFNEPLFWIHLNVDFPFNLKGILYFPKANHEYASIEGQIKLFNNQVFVADNVKEVIPEFLMLLKGVIDCPDLPLNVSRSFLQNDGYVKKISSHITKKVADKLKEIYTKEREEYNKYWDDINVFIKYGCMRDEKFYDKIKDYIIYKDLDGKYLTLPEYLDGKENKDVYYVSDENMQSQYINMFRENGMNAVILPAMMDTHFISFVEMKEDGTKFRRIDSAVDENFKTDESISEQDKEEIVKIFADALGDETLKIEVQSLKKADTSAVILLSEESRRMQEMYRSYGQQFAGMSDMFRDEFTFVLNSNNPLIKKLSDIDGEDRKMLCEHIYDLAMLSHKPLSPEQMTKFIERSNQLMSKII
ncbi:MAG: molecular chaperone HtpG [Ruminococcaceae bacterium]|nr:molecular chaperone HtpG [Oscillospiraceae bacterium]